MSNSIEEISADFLRGIIERREATEYLTRTGRLIVIAGQLIVIAGQLIVIARRLLAARARENTLDFERALAEMKAAVAAQLQTEED